MHKKKDKKINFASPKPYYVDTGYIFPFIPIDPPPGNNNLGMIEWCIEIYNTKKEKGFRHITELLVWAQQTRDKRYDRRPRKILLLWYTARTITLE